MNSGALMIDDGDAVKGGVVAAELLLLFVVLSYLF